MKKEIIFAAVLLLSFGLFTGAIGETLTVNSPMGAPVTIDIKPGMVKQFNISKFTIEAKYLSATDGGSLDELVICANRSILQSWKSIGFYFTDKSSPETGGGIISCGTKHSDIVDVPPKTKNSTVKIRVRALIPSWNSVIVHYINDNYKQREREQGRSIYKMISPMEIRELPGRQPCNN